MSSNPRRRPAREPQRRSADPSSGKRRPQRSDRAARNERARPSDRTARTGRPSRSDRPKFGDRPQRSERPARSDRPQRKDRAATGRPPRSDRPKYSDRPQRSERPARDRAATSGRPPRGDRPKFGDRPIRSDRTQRTEPARIDRETTGRPPRGGRPKFGDRPQRSERPARSADRAATKGRQPRTDRPKYGDRPSDGGRPSSSRRGPQQTRQRPAALEGSTEGERLQKVLARAGVASRRAAEQMMLAGRVWVDGRPATTLGMRVDPVRSRIEVDGQRVHVSTDHEYLLLNKPSGVVTTVRDPQGRPTVLDLVRTERRVYPVGRLDADTQGVLLLTDNGELTH
ncbi:MAG: S4 domain-containing protein, partial [Actinomycetota bacterium]